MPNGSLFELVTATVAYIQRAIVVPITKVRLITFPKGVAARYALVMVLE
jgi:hypothetical protein